MIDCPNGDVRDLLPDFLHGRLDASRRADVEQHLAECEACREELSLLADLRETMRRVPSMPVDAIAAAIPPYRAPVRRGWTTGWRTAAAVAAIAAGGTSVALLHDRDARSMGAASPTVFVAIDAPRAHDPAAGRDSVLRSPERVAAVPGIEPSAPRAASSSTRSRELAMGGGAIGELSDGELAALVDGIESLDALPSTDVEGSEAAGPGSREDLR